MNVLTTEWVEKAKGDLVTAGREVRARKSPSRCSLFPLTTGC